MHDCNGPTNTLAPLQKHAGRQTHTHVETPAHTVTQSLTNMEVKLSFPGLIIRLLLHPTWRRQKEGGVRRFEASDEQLSYV